MSRNRRFAPLANDSQVREARRARDSAWIEAVEAASNANLGALVSRALQANDALKQATKKSQRELEALDFSVVGWDSVVKGFPLPEMDANLHRAINQLAANTSPKT